MQAIEAKFKVRTALTLSIVGAIAVAAHGNTGWQGAAQELVQRRAATMQGVVDYRYYVFRIDQPTYEGLAGTLLAAQFDPDPLLLDNINDWLSENLPPEREAMRGWTAFDGLLWQDHKERSEEDTLQATLDALAQSSNAHAAQLPRLITTHSDGVTETVVEDLRSVTLSPIASPTHPLALQDLSLLPWEEAIAQGPAEGQTIGTHVQGSVHTIVIENGQSGADDYVIAEYAFDGSKGWAPLRAQLRDSTGTVHLDYVSGYDAQEPPGQPARPAAVLRADRAGSDQMVVQLWIIEGWQAWSDPQWLLLRKPPVHLEIDYLPDGDEPLLSIREPSYLEGVTSSQERLQIAQQQIMAHWGTANPETDYNCDGTTDEADLEAAEAVLGSSTGE